MHLFGALVCFTQLTADLNDGSQSNIPLNVCVREWH